MSFAPITSTTSACAKSPLIASVSRTMSYSTFASASSTFICPGKPPRDGMNAEAHAHTHHAELARDLADGPPVPAGNERLASNVPCSLRKATMGPVKVTIPISTPR